MKRKSKAIAKNNSQVGQDVLDTMISSIECLYSNYEHARTEMSEPSRCLMCGILLEGDSSDIYHDHL